jgi:hypothetical protein
VKTEWQDVYLQGKSRIFEEMSQASEVETRVVIGTKVEIGDFIEISD